MTPESAGRHAPALVFRQFNTTGDEIRFIVRCLRTQYEKQGMAWSDTCVLYRSGWLSKKLCDAMTDAGIPEQWSNTKESKKQLCGSDTTVKLMTMHSSKGLEFPLVIVASVGAMQDRQSGPANEAKLLYVAMTRATEKLLATADRASAFTEILAAWARTPVAEFVAMT